VWSHLDRIKVDIPRTYKQLITYEDPRNVKRPETDKSSRLSKIKSLSITVKHLKQVDHIKSEKYKSR
jgi:hypothetical protein